MNILQFAKSFSRKVNVYPAPVPILSSPENLTELSQEDAKKTFAEWENGWKKKNAEDKVSFEYALARMTMCFSLRNIGKQMSLFGDNRLDFNHTNCYSWCPYQEWFVNNEKFIDSFEMYRKEKI